MIKSGSTNPLSPIGRGIKNQAIRPIQEGRGVVQPFQILEQKWAEYIHTPFAVACSSGTTGLHLALAALGIGPGDEVIVPEFTMIATAWAVSYLGATPVFVDCSYDMNVRADDIDKKITKNTKAIIVTHIYGRMVHDILLMGHWGIPVIEDACEAHGAEQIINFGRAGEARRKAGSFGDLAVFSLYKNKIIQSEEGGLVNTKSFKLYEKMQDLKSMSFGKRHNYLHEQIGYNYRLTNMQAKVAIEELSEIDDKIKRRQEFADYLDADLKKYTLPRPKGSVIWVYDMVFKDEATQQTIYRKLQEAGVPARLFFKPMSMQPMYKGYYDKLKAYYYATHGLYVPFELNYMQLNTIVDIVKKYA